VEEKEAEVKMPQRRTLASEYEDMAFDRRSYLEKALRAAKYTIPSLLKDDLSNTPQTLVEPNQSIGADGVNNLSAKVTLAMLPPNQPFFRFSMDALDLKQQAESSGLDPVDFTEAVNKGLSKTETLLVDYNEHNGDRICVGEAFKHVYVAGNVFLLHQPKGGLKYYPLNRFVVKRDYCGNVLKAITKETINFMALPEEIKAEVLENIKKREGKDEIKDLEKKELDLYTVFRRKGKHWKTYQEVERVILEKSKGSYPIDICPFMALRYTRIDGESYGRGLVEEYIGDITYLDVLSKAIKEASLAASKLIMLVNPNGQTKISELAKKKNGDFCAGRAEDVTPLQANKYYDLKTAQEEKEMLERRLYRVFLLAQAVQRDSERTTATEIQYMIRDLEEALGNHYSIMSKEFQEAYIKIAFYHLRKEKKNKLPDIITDKNVHLTITTGLEALGRGSDLNKLRMYLETMAQFAQMAQACPNINPSKMSDMVATSLNLDVSDLEYTEEEQQAMQQQQQQQALMDKVAAPAVNQYGSLLKQQAQQEGENNG
jgi:hypothetical protein